MQLPHTTNSLLFGLTPDSRYVDTTVSGRVIRARELLTGNPIVPVSLDKSPIITNNSPTGQTVFTFNNNHSLRYNFPLGTISPLTGVKNPLTAIAVFQILGVHANDNTVFELGSVVNGNTGFSIDVLSDTSIIGYRYDDTDSVANSSPSVRLLDGKYHVITFIFDGANLLLRRDGILAMSTPLTHGLNKFTADHIAIGDFTDGTAAVFGHAYFIGNIGHVLLYSGSSNIVEVEDYLMKLYGVG